MIDTIEFSDFSVQHIQSRRVCDSDPYVIHDMAIYNDIKINGLAYKVQYQTGQGYYDWDRNRPTVELSFYAPEDEDNFLAGIIEIGEMDEIKDDDIEYIISGLPDSLIAINSGDVLKIYESLKENEGRAVEEFENLELSNDLSDYRSDELGILNLK